MNRPAFVLIETESTRTQPRRWPFASRTIVDRSSQILECMVKAEKYFGGPFMSDRTEYVIELTDGTRKIVNALTVYFKEPAEAK